MKIKEIRLSYGEAKQLEKKKHRRPRKPFFLIGALVRLLSLPTLWKTKFSFDASGLKRAGKGPYLILMNHSSFTDMKLAYRIFYPRHPFSIVCTTDAFIGKSWLLRLMGCIPTQKFVTDVSLVLDLVHAVKANGVSVLLYPEAGYSLDGTATVLPKKFGQLVKKLEVPVLMVKTEGAFLRDPLYNALQLRDVRVSAKVDCLFTKDELSSASVEEIDRVVGDAFTFDAWREQEAAGTLVTEAHRADFLHRVLYRCPACKAEDKTEGRGTTLTCHACSKVYRLEENGTLTSDGGAEFSYVSDWFAWQRECVKQELLKGGYKRQWRVDIALVRDHKGLYRLGEGTLTQTDEGLRLVSDDGELDYTQSAKSSYSLNVDYHWYEIGDVIGLGTRKELYYCFPKDRSESGVTKARLVAEELYKLKTEA
ncbi:MAG: 1-acyl-sn-glycerol-3-phosphate acyltransferase [Clostridia bacterium]|nr:1-acyl-sn-glycerol-3-phosphate acyltransferase [Clostridia bacterium]